MKLLKLSALGFILALATQANARTMSCTSQINSETRLVFVADLETNWWGNTIYSGSYTYRDPVSGATGSSPFACLPANEKGVTFCGATKPDANITSIVAHPIMGFMIQVASQKSIVLFDCQ